MPKKRADGRYVKIINLGRRPDGTYIRKSVYARTKKELEEKVAKIQMDLKRGSFVEDDHITFQEMGEIWINRYKNGIAETTRDRYKSVLKLHLYPYIGGMKLKDLKPLHLQEILNNLEAKGYTGKTMKHIRETANQVMKAAVENDLLYRNVFERTKVTNVPGKERQPLLPETIRLITDNPIGHRMCIPALIMLYCGLRKGEIMALTWEDIDLEADTIRVDKAVTMADGEIQLKLPKTSAGIRLVPIPNLLHKILHRQFCKSGYICKNAGGEPMTYASFRQAWSAYKYFLYRCAGGQPVGRNRPRNVTVQKITPHMLRHTYATLLYDAGVDVKSAQKYLGHADLEVTLGTYTHLSKFKKDQSIEVLNDFLDRKEAL